MPSVRLIFSVMLGLALLSGLFCDTSLAADAPLEAGFAEVDITPLPGYRMSGYFSERINTGTRDPLLAKAVVFQQGDVRAAIVFCDLIGIPLAVSRQAREVASRVTGIPADSISITATHSHTGPLYFGALRQHFHDRSVAAAGSDPLEPLDYSTELVGGIVRSLMAAQRNLRPVSLNAGYAREERLAFNRRFHMKNGTVRFNPGQLNPSIVRPAGPIDPEIGLITFYAADGSRPFAAIVSFALHLDTLGGTQYSADFPGHLQEQLRQSFGKSFMSLFGAGTCGDINHVDVTVKGRRSTEEIGSMLAETIAPRIPQLKSAGRPSLAVKTAAVEVPLQSYSPETVAAAARTMEQVDDPSVPFLDRVNAYKIMALQLRGGDTIPLEVHALRLSEKVAVVTLPGEVFVEHGLAIKQGSPFPTTLVIELANDAPGYIPTRRAFSEGSYETVNSRVVPGSGEEMVATALALLEELGGETETPSE